MSRFLWFVRRRDTVLFKASRQAGGQNPGGILKGSGGPRSSDQITERASCDGRLCIQNTGLPAIRGLGNTTVAPPKEKSTATSSCKSFDDNGDLPSKKCSRNSGTSWE